MTLASYVKPATAKVDYQIDWADVIGIDTIANSTWVVTPATGLTLSAPTFTTATATIWAEAGIPGQVYLLTNTIVTAAGRTDVRIIQIEVDPARTGMATLIRQLRALTNAGVADYTLAGEVYFNDVHLQKSLDGSRSTLRDMPLDFLPERSGATTIWKDYVIPDYVERAIEQDATGSGWQVKNASGTAISNTLYTVNYEAGIISFTANTGGSALTLDCRSYNMNKAAARVWRQRAGFEQRSIDWSSDNHDIKASQRRDYCNQMAELYEAKSGMLVGWMVNPDEL